MMNKFIIGAARASAAVITAFAAVTASAAPVCAAGDYSPKLLFEDNFDGDIIDFSKWEYCPEQVRCNGMVFWEDGLSYVNGKGVLVQEAIWHEDENRLHSGAIQTRGKFEAGYGYYEASVRLPRTYGVWGAFWMMVGDVLNTADGSSDGVELDIVESINYDDDMCNHAMHWNGYGKYLQTDSKVLDRKEVYDGNFHTFALWRTEDYYIFYIDGEETWRSSGAGICPLDGYMMLSVESAAYAGGGTEKSKSELPTSMETDYVRVWDTNPYIAPEPLKRVRDVELKLNGDSTARVTANVSGENEKVAVIAAVYDDDNRLVGVKLRKDVTARAEGTAVEFDFGSANVKKAAAFIWRGADF